MYSLHTVTGNSGQDEKGNQDYSSPDRESRAFRASGPDASGSGASGSGASGIVTRTLDNKTRNIIRTLRNLRDDLKRIYPRDIMPSTWMIKCLVVNCEPCQSHQAPLPGESWDNCVINVMQRLLAKTENAFEIRNSFFELDGVTPLFPNHELFGPQHANRFAKLAVQHLKVQLGKDENVWPARAIR